MQKNSKIVVLLMAVLSLTACEVEREVLKASHEPDEPAGETFNGKKIIKEGTPEYERLVKNGVMLKSEGIVPESLSQKGPEKASRNATVGKIFELPVDLLYEWGVNTTSLDKLTISDELPDFGNFNSAAHTVYGNYVGFYIPADDGFHITSTPGTSASYVSKFGKNWIFIAGSNFHRTYYMYNKVFRPVPLIVFPNYRTMFRAYNSNTGKYAGTYPAYGYYLQDNLKHTGFNDRFLNNTFADGYKYNLGIWGDAPLMYSVYNTGDTDRWGFMYYPTKDWDYDKMQARVGSEPYRSWHPGKKSRILGKYEEIKNEFEIKRTKGDLVLIKTDELWNKTDTPAELWTVFNEQEEETITTTQSISHRASVEVGVEYENSVFELHKIKVSTKLGYGYDNTSTNSTANRKLKSFTTQSRVAVPKGKHYRIELYSYAKRIDFVKGAYLKVFQKLFKDKNNFHVPPFISLNQGTWEPLVNVPLRLFASKSGLANGYRDRYLYTGIDYSGESQNNINAYDLLYMGDVNVAINTTGAMDKMVIVRDLNDNSIVSKQEISVKDLQYIN
jgi:hypothetical protein